MASSRPDFGASSQNQSALDRTALRDLAGYDLQPSRDGPLRLRAWDQTDHQMLADLLGALLGPAEAQATARSVLTEFGGLGGALSAPTRRLEALLGEDGSRVSAFFEALRRVAVRSLRQRLEDRPLLGSHSRLVSYLRALLAHETKEHFRVLYLDIHFRLITDELAGSGTFNHAPVYPREIIRRGLDVAAKNIVLVHNHPSGDPTPSRADIETTRRVAASASVFEIELVDHYVVGRSKVRSMKGLGLLPTGPLYVDYEPRGMGKAVVRTRPPTDAGTTCGSVKPGRRAEGANGPAGASPTPG